MIEIIIVLCAVLLYILYLNKLKLYRYGYGNKLIVIIAGVHGNEPAGPIALKSLIAQQYFARLDRRILSQYRFIIIPRVNEIGLLFGRRYNLFNDINRSFSREGGCTKISKTIAGLIKNAHLVLDFHEGWGYVGNNNGSIGSSISPVYNAQNIWVSDLAHKMRDALNNNIASYKKFSVLSYQASSESQKMLEYYAAHNNINYILIETTGQDNIQPIDIRTAQIHLIIDTMMNSFII